MLGQSTMRPVRPLSVRARIFSGVVLSAIAAVPRAGAQQPPGPQQQEQQTSPAPAAPQEPAAKSPAANSPAARRNCQKLSYRETSRQTQTKAQCAGVTTLCADAYASRRCAGRADARAGGIELKDEDDGSGAQ